MTRWAVCLNAVTQWVHIYRKPVGIIVRNVEVVDYNSYDS